MTNHDDHDVRASQVEPYESDVGEDQHARSLFLCRCAERVDGLGAFLRGHRTIEFGDQDTIELEYLFPMSVKLCKQ